jgi:acyl-CoA synthetase (AMP-forming)/AMP-acid ligase II
VVRGDQIMAGYWHRPADTASAIVDGWLHTGDAGRRDSDGYLYIEDRIKDMIISGGENVYPAEVERVLSAHPDIGEIAVIGVPDAKWGEAVKAVVAPLPGASIDEEKFLAYARENLAGYKRPKSVDVVAALPRNATGKILKRELRAPYWEDHERAI